MTDTDKPALDAPLSAQRRRTATARSEREARLAASLRANIARRKQQARNREAGKKRPGPDDAAGS